MSSSASDGICPLCNGTARVQISEKYDLKIVLCERCGYFQIADDALLGVEHECHLLAGLAKRASTPEPRVATRLTFTRESVPTFLSGSGIPRDPIDQQDIVLEYAKEHQKK